MNCVQTALKKQELFHKTGLVYFWVINDGTDRDRLTRMADQFQAAGIAAVVLHPRSGLLVPYGSRDWFELIRWLIDLCHARDIQIWLYDEDPFPSGNAGGLVVADHPEYIAREIVEYAYKPDEAQSTHKPSLFRFPLHKLLWCGIVDSVTGSVQVELTDRVGVLRETWQVLEQWDSRYYYPKTPIYSCPRAWTYGPTHALQVPRIPDGMKLVAYIAQPASAEHWEHLADPLNPDATQAFLQRTHDRYAESLGEHIGSVTPAIFTDEAKPAGHVPYTSDLLEAFQYEYHYELAPRLPHLFMHNVEPECVRTRLDFRKWVTKRFEQSWMKPVKQWCDSHDVYLVGHFSPEDDLVEQAATLGNLLPLQRYLSIPGVDLIVPATGDGDHPVLNIGIIAARSICDQYERPGVLSESLACSGTLPDHRVARRVLSWQTVMGLTTPVIHAAYESMEGNRAIDAPPDWGPMVDDWPKLCQLGNDLKPLQSVIRQSRQIAPVAVIWPISTYHALGLMDLQEEVPLRNELHQLITLMLDKQISFHFVDEADLSSATITGSHLRVGAANYQHLVIPPSLVLHQTTCDLLNRAAAAGIDVRGVGSQPKFCDTDARIEPLECDWSSHPLDDNAMAQLPRTIETAGNTRNLRSSAWSHPDGIIKMITNLNNHPVAIEIDGKQQPIAPADVWLKIADSPWVRAFCGHQE